MKKTLFLAVFTALATAMAQETFIFTAHLSGSNQVILFGKPLAGEGLFSLTGSNLTYQISVPFGGWEAEIHGPAAQDTTAPVIFDLGHPGCAVPFPPLTLGGCEFSGSLVLSDTQIAELMAGLWYANAFFLSVPNAEIRGQILLDSDQDGVPDDQDECPNTQPGAVVDAHGCSIEQLCPCDGPWKNHGEYLKCVRIVTADFERAGLITEAQEHAIVKEARTSKCGIRRHPPRHEDHDEARQHHGE